MRIGIKRLEQFRKQHENIRYQKHSTPKTKKDADEKRKSVRKNIEFKKELIAKYEFGVRISVLAKEFGMADSTICTIKTQRCEVNEPLLFIFVSKRFLIN